MTNRDKLNGMSNEELAEYIFDRITNPCLMCQNSYYNEETEIYVCNDLNLNCSENIRQWLEQEVKEECL